MNCFRIFSLISFIVIAAHADAGQIEPKYKGKPLAYWVDRLQSAPTDEEQHKAAEAIAAFGADADTAVPKLVEMLDDRSPEFRGLISGVLATIGVDAKSVVPAMMKLLKEKRARHPELVIEILQEAGPKAKDAVPVLTETLANEKLTKPAIRALRAIGPAAKDSVPHLMKMLDRGDAEVRFESARALWNIAKHPKAVPALISILENVDKGIDTEIFLQAIDALGEIGPDAKAALPALRMHSKNGRAAGAIERIEGSNK
jgi:HEAT repeat protein